MRLISTDHCFSESLQTAGVDFCVSTGSRRPLMKSGLDEYYHQMPPFGASLKERRLFGKWFCGLSSFTRGSPTKRIESGELTEEQINELFKIPYIQSFSLTGDEMRLLKPSSITRAFPFDDLSLTTHDNVVTGDIVRAWEWEGGGNLYGDYFKYSKGEVIAAYKNTET
jgi:hypothetical protein